MLPAAFLFCRVIKMIRIEVLVELNGNLCNFIAQVFGIFPGYTFEEEHLQMLGLVIIDNLQAFQIKF